MYDITARVDSKKYNPNPQLDSSFSRPTRSECFSVWYKSAIGTNDHHQLIFMKAVQAEYTSTKGSSGRTDNQEALDLI